MRKVLTICCILLIFFNFLSCTTAQKTNEALGLRFKEEAIGHVQHLASLGIRAAGTETETRAITYIKKCMKKAGLSVSVEPFEFECFVLKKAALKLGQEQLEPSMIFFNPYSGEMDIKDEALFVDPSSSRGEIQKIKGENKIFVTARPANFFQLAMRKPKAVIYVEEKDFRRLSSEKENVLELSVQGEVKRFQSSNVVASLMPKSGTNREIILSAHLDSILGPGADDNASGIAVLIQLAKHFKNIKQEFPCRLKFVAFGAEEIGMIGSKVYVENHKEELKNCELMFNMDTVGGSEKIFVEMRGGIEGVSKEKGKSQYSPEMSIIATTDSTGKWRLLHPSQLIYASNVPGWLRDTIETCSAELGYEITPSYMMGSDHRIFAQAGIPATDIAIAGNKHHSPEDIPEHVNPESMLKAAKIVAGVVTKTMERF